MFDRNNYPYLNSFIASNFFDSDDFSWELDDVIPEYVRTAHPSSVLGVRADIERFLYEHGNDAEEAFIRVLQPIIDPRGAGESRVEWLRDVARRLKDHQENPS